MLQPRSSNEPTTRRFSTRVDRLRSRPSRRSDGRLRRSLSRGRATPTGKGCSRLLGLTGSFPLWGRPTRATGAGIRRPRVRCPSRLRRHDTTRRPFAGRRSTGLPRRFAELRRPVRRTRRVPHVRLGRPDIRRARRGACGDVVLRDGRFAYCDILPTDTSVGDGKRAGVGVVRPNRNCNCNCNHNYNYSTQGTQRRRGTQGVTTQTSRRFWGRPLGVLPVADRAAVTRKSRLVAKGASDAHVKSSAFLCVRRVLCVR